MRIELMLPPAEWERAEKVGRARARNAQEGGMTPKFAYQKGGRTLEETHIYGARGEAAFALALGVPWPATVRSFRVDPDVDPNWEVRTTPRTSTMKVARNDPPERVVAFVLNEWGSPAYKMVGCVVAGWAQKNVPATDPGDRGEPAHFVRLSQLTAFTPDFHSTHGWFRNEAGVWSCAYCTTPYEGATP